MKETNNLFMSHLVAFCHVFTDWSVEKLEDIDLTSKPPGCQVLLVVPFLSCEKAFQPCFSIYTLKIKLVDTQEECLGNNKHLDPLGRLVAQLRNAFCFVIHPSLAELRSLRSIFSSDLECPDKEPCK